MTYLSATSLALGLAGLVCLVASLLVRPKNVKSGLVLVAMLWLLMGAGMQLRVWSDELESQRATSKVQANAVELLSIARTTRWPENRDQALGLMETALRLLAPGESEQRFPLTELMALISIVLGSVTLTLALTRPDILMTRRERDAQIIKNTAPVAASGVDL